jgi:hypothetical protein
MGSIEESPAMPPLLSEKIWRGRPCPWMMCDIFRRTSNEDSGYLE